jgi:hypothetical protein
MPVVILASTVQKIQLVPWQGIWALDSSTGQQQNRMCVQHVLCSSLLLVVRKLSEIEEEEETCLKLVSIPDSLAAVVFDTRMKWLSSTWA